ncbi:cystatin-9-like [Ictidomys tridecemlineatus]|uniref:cystatin-9-like n=1 Tax=Ictidomys tridecemlineatus TaxID=43179 RepID=UPI001A9FBD5D|nr:cystatin-9-like [Ictidomys tridecemlineatus]
MVLPWVPLLLLLGRQLLASPILYRAETTKPEDPIVKDQYFPPTLEFAVYKFNRLNEDQFAYKLLKILNAKKVDVDSPLVFAMNVKLGRTKCYKFEDNIDNCPFQDTLGRKRTLNCFFVVSTYPWRTAFELLKNVCTY